MADPAIHASTASPEPRPSLQFSQPGLSPPASQAWGVPAHGTVNAPGAVAAMVLGIVGVTLWWIPFLGWGMIIVDILAIVLGAKALKAIKMNAGLTGKGMATTGLVLGIVGLCFWLIVVLVIGIVLAALSGAAHAAAGA